MPIVIVSLQLAFASTVANKYRLLRKIDIDQAFSVIGACSALHRLSHLSMQRRRFPRRRTLGASSA
jgi:hypothetical protein